MSNEIVRYLVGGFLVIHGIGHVGGYWMFLKSWLSPALTASPLKWLFVLLWLIAMLGYFVACIGLFQVQSWWRMLAIAASVVSLIVSVLYIQGVPFNAAVADVVILGALLWLNFPSAEMVGS